MFISIIKEKRQKTQKETEQRAFLSLGEAAQGFRWRPAADATRTASREKGGWAAVKVKTRTKGKVFWESPFFFSI